MSRNRENYSINQRNLFDEVYGLASTQALKNKDIPEGGSKGAILPDLGANPQVVFCKFVDAIFDLLLPGKTPGVKDKIVDLYGKEEIVRPLSTSLSPSPSSLSPSLTLSLILARAPAALLRPGRGHGQLHGLARQPRSRARRRLVEGELDGQAGVDARRHPARHVRHDEPVGARLHDGHLPQARPARGGHQEGPDGRAGRRPWLECVGLLSLSARSSGRARRQCRACCCRPAADTDPPRADEILLSKDKTTTSASLLLSLTFPCLFSSSA